MRWTSNPVNSAKASVLAAALHDSKLKIAASTLPVLADLLVGRGIEEPEAAARFLSPALSDLHDPLRMTGMKSALDRLEAALERKEKILIYGDYDVDGTTAIVILKTAIELCGGAADFHVPHRIREGYGMRDEVIERAAADGVRLIISVDTGIRAFAAAETARRTGVDLIVTDHHLPGLDGVPQALVVLNPNQNGCDYPCKYLCGAGVAFKLAQGLMQRRLDIKDQSRLLMSFMKVVAIATIADAVPLLGENRVFAKLGLQGLRRPVNVGLKALLEVAKLGDGRALTASEVAHAPSGVSLHDLVEQRRAERQRCTQLSLPISWYGRPEPAIAADTDDADFFPATPGTVFELKKTATGYAAPTALVEIEVIAVKPD